MYIIRSVTHHLKKMRINGNSYQNGKRESSVLLYIKHGNVNEMNNIHILVSQLLLNFYIDVTH